MAHLQGLPREGQGLQLASLAVPPGKLQRGQGQLTTALHDIGSLIFPCREVLPPLLGIVQSGLRRIGLYPPIACKRSDQRRDQHREGILSVGGDGAGDSIPHPQLAVSMVIRRALPTLAQGEIAGAQPTPADRQGWVGQSGGKTLRVGW